MKSSSRVMSPLKMSGAATSDQSDTWVYCSFGVRGVGLVAALLVGDEAELRMPISR